ncbi:MAG TPA: hypothetical protein VNM90_05895 [Haliangium sp.]|nr:hypothetical protein [Haliangium sp.]
MKVPRLLFSRALVLLGLAMPGACTVNQGPSPEMARQPPPATPPQPVGMSPSQALGLWQSSFGAVKIEPDSGQPDRLMGIWLYDRTGQEVIGFFTGPLRGNVLEFTWHEPAQPRDLVGAGFLVFEPDGSRFTGTWWTGDQSRSGDWNGWRVAQARGAPPLRHPEPIGTEPPPWAQPGWKEEPPSGPQGQPAPQGQPLNPSYGSQDAGWVPPQGQPPPPPPY